MLRRVHLSQLVVVAAVCCVLLLTPPAQPLLPFVSAQQESPNHQQQQPQPVQLLAPFDYLNGQLVDLDSGVNLYRFRGLKPHTGYELRVSFPASVSLFLWFCASSVCGVGVAGGGLSVWRCQYVWQ